MKSLLRRSSRTSSFVALLAVSVTAALTGCGVGFDNSAAPSVSVPLSGMLHGGPNPVVGATITLYATQSNGYGGAGTVLASTTTSGTGSFTFNPASYTCPAGQQAYITAAAGNTGANTVNSNSLMLAAIGPCSSLSASTYIWIDELSTVAAAYALSNFITISGTGATAVVDISAPANNNAATGSCTGTGTAMTCKAAGLTHAFLNAANLVNAIGTSATPPTGLAYSTPASNPTTTATAVALQNVVPQQLINTLGNILQACVNSNGGVAGDTSVCGKLFTATTPSTTYTAAPIKPANTLQAVVNLAKFPFTSPSTLYGLAPSNGFYQPTLTSAPPDFSIAIIWRSYGSGANQLGSVYYTTTDINDNVYATALTAASTGSAFGGAPYIAHALSSNGVGNWTAPTTISTSTTNLCSSYGGTAATSAPCIAATDALGHLWVSYGTLNSPGFTGGLWQLNTSTGAATQFTTAYNGTTYYPFALAVDRANDVFYSSANTSGANELWEMPSGATSSTVPTSLTPGGVAFLASHLPGSLALDASGNLFGSLNSGSGEGYVYAANTGTLSAPAFATAAQTCNNCLTTTIPGINKWPSSSMVDASGNFWMSGQNGLYQIPAATAQTATGVTAYAIGGAATTLRLGGMDGAGTIFIPDSGTTGAVNPTPPPTASSPSLRIYYPALAAQATLLGCNVGVATGNTACINGNGGAPNNQLFYQAINPAIDATGSIWVSSEGNDAVIQILGTAAPTWPQASYLHPAVMPQ